MKPAASTIVNTGTLSGVSRTMTIARDTMAHIMSVLTNLYSDAILAVLREYSTNALDAHRESGYTGPIMVTVPSGLRPTFTVEDFGVGMSTDTLLDLYSSYGASTKRGTNEQTGMLGLGSKSALAYSSQFTIRSRHAGVETTALIFLNDKGEGEIKIVDTKATDKTGTRIEIPVGPKDVKSFEKHAAYLFSFWKSQDVTVKGVGVTSGFDSIDWNWITPGVALTPKILDGSDNQYRSRYEPGKIVAVQGGVPYTVDVDSLDDHTKALAQALPLDSHSVVLIAPIGSLQFTPSRESLYYTVNTQKALAGLFETYKREVGKWIGTKIAAAADKQAALREYEKFSHLVPNGAPVKWNGKIIPASIPCRTLTTNTSKRAGGSRSGTLPKLAGMAKYDIVIYGASASQATDKGSYQIRLNAAGYLGQGYKLVDRYYGRSAGTDTKHILIIEGDLPDEFDWYGLTAVSVDAIKPSKGVKVAGVSQAALDYHEREWKIVDGSYYGNRGKIDPNDDKVCIVTREQQEDYNGAPNEWTVVMVPQNQWAKFRVAFPLAKTPGEIRKNVADLSGIVLDEAASTYGASMMGHRIKELDPSKVLDPDLASVVSWMKNRPATVTAAEALQAKYAWLRVEVEVKKSPTPTLNQCQRRYGDYLGYLTGQKALDLVNALYVYKYQGGTP
jgi:hypothetical protein